MDQEELKRNHFKIGSRKSKLAMIQTEYIRDELIKLNSEYTFEIVNFDTKGDQILDRALAKIGDKGLFTKELEDALLNGTIDFVVHSLKDMPCQVLPENLCISGIPLRENPSDAVVMSKKNLQSGLTSLDDLKEGSTVGTSSLRRIAQLKSKYPHLKFENIRGNLNTRFAKLDDENCKFDAIILAIAGLTRLGFQDRITNVLTDDICKHAVGQGALGVECRSDDELVIKMLNRLNDENTVLRCIAERGFLASLEGGCSTPIGVNSIVTSESISLEGIVLSLDGSEKIYEKFEVKFNGDFDESNCPLSFNASQLDNQLKKQSFSYVIDLKIDLNKQARAHFCGTHLGSMMIAKGADRLIHESKIQMKKD
jgi:hydroxymethylbilane synthase